MNPAVTAFFKEDMRYTVSMFLYVAVIGFLLGLFFAGQAGDGQQDAAFFFYYIELFGTLITNSYLCSKAKMDRFFSLGFLRGQFAKMAVWSGVCRCALLAAGFTALGACGRLLCGMPGIFGNFGMAFAQDETLAPAVNFLLLFFAGWLVCNHMLMDATFARPRISASVYLTSPSIWAFNNSKQAKKRSGSRPLYVLAVVLYVLLAIVLSALLRFFYTWWLAAVVFGALAALNAIFLCVFLHKIKRMDII